MLKKIVITMIACFAIGSVVNAQESLTQGRVEQEQVLPENTQFSLSDSAQMIASLGASARELKKQGLPDDQIFRLLQCELETNSRYAGVKHFAKRTVQIGSLIVISMTVGASLGFGISELARFLDII